MGGFGFSISAILAVRNNRALTSRGNAIASYKGRARDIRLASKSEYYSKDYVSPTVTAKKTKEVYKVRKVKNGNGGFLWILGIVVMLLLNLIIFGAIAVLL